MNHRHQPSTTAAADGLQLGSGLRRIACLAALLFIFVAGVRAVEYKIKVAGVPVTSSNASNVTGDYIKAYSSSVNGGKPSVVYNSSTNTLTLWNVKIERKGSGNRAILNDGVAGLKVVLRGQNYLKAENSSPVRFNANTTLTSTYNGTKERSWIIGDEEDALTVGSGATLTILDADLWLEAANSSAFDASGSPSLIIKNSSVQALSKADALSSDSHALQNYYSLSVYNSEVILRQYSIFGAAVKNLASFTLGTDMVCYVWPWTKGDLYSEEGHFDSSRKTFWGNKSNSSVWEVDLKRDGVVINSTNFPNQNFRNYVSSTSIDKNGDGFLGKSEIAKVTSLNVNGRSITSLTGIEYFTELTSLDCSTNSLTSLNLSNNTKLTKLFCSNNRLTTLDVSKNTALTTLDCSNNQLTSLDLSKNTKLTTLEVYKNKIRGLDASSFIRYLPQVSNGQLKFFYNENATTGNLMTTVQVEDAKKKGWTPKESTNGSTWTDYNGAIFISSTTFPDANFRNFLLAQSYGKDGYLTEEEIAKIKQLDVSGRSISDLTGIEYFTELTYLNCSNNSLTSLDLSNNTKLLTLHCFNNQLTALNIKYNIEYMDVYCYGNKLNDPSNVTYLLNHLPSHGGTLYFYKDETPTGNWLSPVSVAIFKRNNWAVKKANNNGGWEDYEGEDAIAIQWIRDENFRSYVSTNFDKNGDGWLLPSEIAAVTEIDVSSKSISSLKGIEYFTALTSLRCFFNQLTELDVSKNTALTKLNCQGNQLKSLDVSKNTALIELACGSNQLTELNVSKNTQLTGLACDGNQLKSLDVSKNTALKWLYCEGNELTSLDVSKNTTLAELWCFNNLIRGRAMTDLVNSLPDWKSASGEGKMYVYRDETPAGNLMTPKQVEVATSKNWSVLRYDADNWVWVDYEGEPADGIEISEENFPDEKFREYVGSKTIDTDEDGNLSDDEIAAAKEIDVNNKGISDLTGIEYFVGLEYLLCHDNNLTTLDVSKNKVLRVISCWGNHIRGEGMKTLVNSLHSNFVDNDWPEVLRPRLIVIKANEAPVFNLITEAQVEIATEKGWAVKKLDFSVGEVDYEGETLPGDANGDGEVNATDIDCLRDYVLGLDPQPFSLESANLNGDSAVDIQDLTQLIEILLKR